MKAMILAAGRGKRMRPLTDSTPKPLLQVAGKALIEYHIEALVRAGITELVINHAWLGRKIVEQLGDGSRYGASIQYSTEAEALETGGGIRQALPLLGEEPFLVVNGDIWCDYPFAQLKQREVQKAHLVLVENPAHNLGGDFVLQDGLALSEGDGPRYTFAGISLMHPSLLDGFNEQTFALKPPLLNAMEDGQVSAELYIGRWVDVGTPERLQQLDAELAGADDS